MKKKRVIGCISLIFMLLAISFATTVSSNTTNVEKKESPLYRIRTGSAIGEKSKDLTTRFIRNRLFFLPGLLEKTGSVRDIILFKTGRFTDCPTRNCICAQETQENVMDMTTSGWACTFGYKAGCTQYPICAR